MVHLNSFQSLLLSLRHATTLTPLRDAPFWIVTALIALLLPSTFAAPLLLDRLRRTPDRPDQ